MSQLTNLSTVGTVLLAGPLPSSIGSISQLQVLRLSGGPDNLGTLPPEWGQLQALAELSLYDMELSGALPAAYSNMTALAQLVLYNVSFSGGQAQLPGDWSQLQVTEFNLSNVSGLSGGIPSSWRSSGMQQLSTLSVQSVSTLNATLEEWWAFISRPGAPPQQIVLLTDNGMQGTMPAGITDANR